MVRASSTAGGALILAALSAPAFAEVPSFTIAPYVWAPRLRGDVSLGGLSVPLSLPVRQLADGFKGGGLGYVSADWRGGFVYGEGIYIRYGEDRFRPFFGEAVHASVGFGEGGAGLHRTIAIGPRATLRLSPYVGLRAIALRTRVAGSLITTAARRDTLDPVAGLIAELPVAPRVGLIAKVDGAGFGLSDNHYVSAAALAEYRFNRHVAVDAGYRASRARIPGGAGLGLALRGRGPMLGLRYTIRPD